MKKTSRHDAWSLGENYEAYMGRWSRRVALKFLEWINPKDDLDWLDVGCGTGALSNAVLSNCNPRSVVGVDPSEEFIELAEQKVSDPRIGFRLGDAQALPLRDSSKDVVVSALALNFVPDKQKALTEMARVARPGGTVALYVWDYPGGGVEFMHAFWVAAAAIDPAASDLAEDKRFPDCTRDGLAGLAAAAGLQSVEIKGIEIPTVFKTFDDFWRPFTLGTGPAPGYCMSLETDHRERLRNKLADTLYTREDGSIGLSARAWAFKVQIGPGERGL